MKEFFERLQTARRSAGYEGATEAAEAMGWPVSTYLSHENGARTPKNTTAEKYARAFRVSTGWLITGYGPMKGRLVPVVGYVGAGAELHFVDDHEQGAGLDMIEAPAELAGTAVAVIVRGNSMYPAYSDGDVIFYDHHEADPAILNGRECVVRLETGETYIKVVQASNASFNLISHNAPPMLNVSIEWAAPVAWVKKS